MIAPRFLIPRTPETLPESAAVAPPRGAARPAPPAPPGAAAGSAGIRGGQGTRGRSPRGGRARSRARACGKGGGAGERYLRGGRAGDATCRGLPARRSSRATGTGATRGAGAAPTRRRSGQLGPGGIAGRPSLTRRSRPTVRQDRGRPVRGAAARRRGRRSCDARSAPAGTLTSRPGTPSAAARCSWPRCTGAWTPSTRFWPMVPTRMPPITVAPLRCRRRLPLSSRRSASC